MDCLVDHALPISIARPVLSAGQAGRRWVFAVSLAGHLGLLVLAGSLAWQRLPAPPQVAVPVVFLPAPEALPAPQEWPAADLIRAMPQTARLTAPPPLHLNASPDRLAPPGQSLAELPARRRARPAPAPATARAAPATAMAAPPAAAGPALETVDPNAFAALEARIHHAVQAAAIYPNAARMQRREGRTQVRFDYQDGAVTHLAVSATSQSRLLDEAALDAVRHASMPAKPSELAGRKMPALLVWVDFHLTSEE